MFLTADNKLKVKWLMYGVVITAILVVLGILGADKVLYAIINNSNCNMWEFGGGFFCSVAFIIGKLFSAKIWLVSTFLSLMVVFTRKSLDSGIKHKNVKGRFSVFIMVKDFFAKVRTNYAFLIFSSVVLALSVTMVLKFLIGRSRPILFYAWGRTYFEPFVYDFVFNSMPSGHTAATFAGLVMVGMLAPRVKPITWTLAIIVGVSRIYIGAHWPTDVILGAFIGMVAADVVKYLAFKRK